ncbi:MFS transporter [Dermacoccus abyssi]|uniref:MFS transporter n=1 Tax=Dermacoccus abyssi TaxID=322596 RepID=UPI002AD4FA18|nr:MFS transporter [Dermacoccus abyssi]
MSSVTRADLGRRRAAVAAAFAGQGFVFILLTTRLPRLQERFDLSPGDFSLLMLALVLCAGVGSLLGERIAPRRGSGLALRLGFALVVLSVPAMAAAPSVALLAVGMSAYGIALGLADAGTNMQGVGLEHSYGRTIMPTFHAAWTCGGVAATVLALLTKNWSFEAVAVVGVLVPLTLVAAPYVRGAGTVTPIGDDGSKVPWRRILPVGIAMVLFYTVDTATTTWGPSYLHHVFGSGAALVAVATLPYLVASLVGRASGDRLAEHFGAAHLVRSAAFVGAAGLGVVVFAPHPLIAVLGFTVAGLGLATVAPLAFSAAAKIAREQTSSEPEAVRAKVDAIIARFNQFNYLGGILGAVMTGAVGNDSLRYGFAIPMVFVLFLAPLARSFR